MMGYDAIGGAIRGKKLRGDMFSGMYGLPLGLGGQEDAYQPLGMGFTPFGSMDPVIANYYNFLYQMSVFHQQQAAQNSSQYLHGLPGGTPGSAEGSNPTANPYQGLNIPGLSPMSARSFPSGMPSTSMSESKRSLSTSGRAVRSRG